MSAVSCNLPSGSTHSDSGKPDFEKILVAKYGVLIPLSEVWRVLGYPSHNAYRKAIQKKELPIPVFQIDNRKGRFAFSIDVANWMNRIWEEKATKST
ncbi:hypothetical protein [Pseudoalteromonas luteoviolacea]|uniref:Pyocin activator protein PrtN n=1 Tax=Pseudoalteromonas luteoviolacea S4060-1 TaxID=1365257 RepID=A0A167JBN2_9GAMM|nr:hypothetical protein [Pseudoalteromonas luteoviolacea]KZN60873.1 hypothetical protein N478_26055 [Pseudoalteromonas luteoviolacea S4060-1]